MKKFHLFIALVAVSFVALAGSASAASVYANVSPIVPIASFQHHLKLRRAFPAKVKSTRDLLRECAAHPGGRACKRLNP